MADVMSHDSLRRMILVVVRAAGRQFGQFDQAVFSGGRVKEGDTAAGMADTRTRYDAAGLEALLLGSAEMIKLIREDAQKYAAAAKQANIKME